MCTDSPLPDLSYQSTPLPEDLEKLKFHGDFEGAQKAITLWLGREIPAALRRRLEMERGVLDLLAHNEYPHTLEAAQRIMAEHFRDYHPEELLRIKETGRADWAYVNGRLHFQRRFFENLLKTQADYAARLIKPAPAGGDSRNDELLDGHIRRIKTRGEGSAEIRLRVTLGVKKEFAEPGRTVFAHLPIPQEGSPATEFKLLRASIAGPSDPLAGPPDSPVEPSGPLAGPHIAPPGAPHRTVFFTAPLGEGEVFSLEYSFVNRIRYADLAAPEKAAAYAAQAISIENRPPPSGPLFLGEQLPHIRFTPYLRLLLEEILEGETAPLQRARRIYDFITTRVGYAYMREYAAIENISQYAAVNLKGDCGVQAILFITLCRMAGIPAAWQSGLYVTPDHAGCHDWARFYVEPWGWLFADPSFGGSAWRKGDRERGDYYFGNLDLFRMPANSAIMADFSPPKKHPRADPVDSQCGELEYEDRGLPAYALETTQEVISFSIRE
ncbi:MAG: transglutaminase-like domain-containing protein [Spirochaetaceae bacterium]|nr:transglutaminase-like domain-containing protein [Spirochaetaceae bacterium]